MPMLNTPITRRLHCRDPRIVKNFVSMYEKLEKQHKLRETVEALDKLARYPSSPFLEFQYETLDAIRCEIMSAAEKRCRTLKKGQVACSPISQEASRRIAALALLVKKKKGVKVSLRLLSRSLKKAKLAPSLNGDSLENLEEQLKTVYEEYHEIKKDSIQHRHNYLEELAEALADSNNDTAEKMLRQLQEREIQRCTAHKIRFLRGKVSSGNTTMVAVEAEPGVFQDIADKTGIEHAIMESNYHKFRQSLHTPFYQLTLVRDFGNKGTSQAAAAVLAGVYESNYQIPQAVHDFLPHLHMPESIQQNPHPYIELKVDHHQQFWSKAWEKTACAPDALSFSTMKAGATSIVLSTIDCLMTRIPLKLAMYFLGGADSST
jgi:hypothetical protein